MMTYLGVSVSMFLMTFPSGPRENMVLCGGGGVDERVSVSPGDSLLNVDSLYYSTFQERARRKRRRQEIPICFTPNRMERMINRTWVSVDNFVFVLPTRINQVQNT